MGEKASLPRKGLDELGGDHPRPRRHPKSSYNSPGRCSPKAGCGLTTQRSRCVVEPEF